MSGRAPDAIWQDAVEEGDRRLGRSGTALGATGIVGGVDVMIGVMFVVVVIGALESSVSAPLAHLLGSAAFGLAFVFIVIGRSELFTENFLIPLGAVSSGDRKAWSVARLWAITLVANVAGMLLFAAILATDGVLEQSARDAAGTMADTFATRDLLPALLSAILAGTIMTIFTWLTAAADEEMTRVVAGLLVGFVLVAPSLNHAIVGTGEMMFGVLAGTADHATWRDIAQNLPVAIAGNLLGGVAFVTLTRLLQAYGEDSDAG